MNIALNRTKNKKVKKVFLSLDTKIYETSKVDIILSPEFYWVRVFKLPVKSITQAKTVIPSLFEDLIVDNDKLAYYIIKIEENKYLCFAYINQNIFEAIKNSGINISLINNIYFAQNECIEFKEFYINNSSFLYTEDKILIKVPNEILSYKFQLENVLNNINLSSHKVDVKFYNNSLEKGQIFLILFCCLFVFLVNISKYFLYSNEIYNIDKQIENMKIENNLPSSMLQVNSILNSNEKILQKEIIKRDAIYYLVSNSKFTVKEISLDNDLLNIYFEGVNKDEVESYISKKYKIDLINIKENIINIKVQL